MTEKLNLYQRLLAIQKDAGATGKARTAPKEAGGYKFTGIDDVVEHLRPHLIAHGVVILPSLLESNSEIHKGKDFRGKERMTHICRQRVAVKFINADNPQEEFSVAAEGEGIDYSDKAPGMAFSYALKTALLAVFNLRGQPDIETEDNQRSSAQPDTSEPQATSKQLDELKKLAEDKRSTKKVDGVTLKSYIVPLLKDGCTESAAAKMIVWAKEQLGDAKPASPANVNRLQVLMNSPEAQKVMVKDVPIAKHLARLLEEEPSDEKVELAIKWAKKELEGAEKGEAA